MTDSPTGSNPTLSRAALLSKQSKELLDFYKKKDVEIQQFENNDKLQKQKIQESDHVVENGENDTDAAIIDYITKKELELLELQKKHAEELRSYVVSDELLTRPSGSNIQNIQQSIKQREYNPINHNLHNNRGRYRGYRKRAGRKRKQQLAWQNFISQVWGYNY